MTKSIKSLMAGKPLLPKHLSMVLQMQREDGVCFWYGCFHNLQGFPTTFQMFLAASATRKVPEESSLTFLARAAADKIMLT